MITGELKSRVDRIRDTMWSGGVSNPLTVIEQLTYLLFVKRLDELHTLAENRANRTAALRLTDQLGSANGSSMRTPSKTCPFCMSSVDRTSAAAAMLVSTIKASQ